MVMTCKSLVFCNYKAVPNSDNVGDDIGMAVGAEVSQAHPAALVTDSMTNNHHRHT